ncbi:hypothetical protein B296_00021604 [Ensete ventricosum]|uniref:Uncharacterized protein n=1 Tax=Ensete ventricosum TaxID=4639 RepID=A0A426ZYG3_ENSVE|nr:hypothetical protein B296_00021604 [Ensete ventricosum]
MDLNVLCKKPRMPRGKSAPVAGPESAQPEVELIHTKASAKQLVGSPVVDQATAGRPGKWVKIAVRKHKSHRDEGSSRRAAREREMEVSAEDSSLTYRRPKSMRDLCSMYPYGEDEGGQGHHYHMTLLDMVHDLGRLVTHMGNQPSLLKAELEKLKTKRDPNN